MNKGIEQKGEGGEDGKNMLDTDCYKGNFKL